MYDIHHEYAQFVLQCRRNPKTAVPGFESAGLPHSWVSEDKLFHTIKRKNTGC